MLRSMAEGKENDRKQTRNKNGENDSSSAEEGKSNRHLSRKRKPEGDNRIAEEDYRGTSWSHRLDDRKSRRDRQDSDGRDKSIENGMISEEEKGDRRYSESRRDPEKRDAKYSGSRWSRYGNDHDQHRNHGHRNEGSKKQSGESDLSGTVDKTEENDGKDQDNDQPSLNREQWLKTGLDDKQNYTARSKYKNVDKEIDRRNSRFENRDKENDIGRSKYEDSDTENDRRISRRFDDRSGNSDRKRSRDESYTGRGRPEEDENHQKKRRHCSDDKITWDGSEQNMDRDGRKRSRRREDDDVRDGRARHEEKQRHKHASRTDSNVKIDRQENERNDDGAPKKRTGEVGGEEKSMEFQKRQSPAFSARNGEAANNEKAVGRSGGVYIPPFKLAQMMKDVQDKSSPEYQRLTWDALRKSINGLVNKVNASNIKNIIPELFAENLIRGRGLFCRSCMKSQMASPGFTDVFAALVAVVNTKFPEVGSLLLRRIILQLKRAFKRNDKHVLLAAAKFIAHLVNQQVAHEIIALELLTVLLENPTDDSVEVAVGFVKECGSLLQDLSPQGLHGIFERFRGILHEGEIDKRVQFLIEGLFAIRKAKFQGFPAVRPELDLVEQEDQFTHEYSLEDELDQEVALDIFKPDPEFLEHEKAYENLKKDILGEESSDEVEGENNSEEDSDDDEDEEEEDEEMLRIKDETETNLINLRRTIYLTIMSSVDFEEAGHKLLKIKLEPGQEMELCIMLLECCSQERTYLRYYGLLGQRFCMINKIYQEFFDKCFVQQYSMIHRLETNKLRNVAKFFAHLLGTDALPWHALAYIRLTEEDTTSSSRIFIKILFQELAEQLGIRKLNERLNDPTMQDSFDSIFPKDNPKNSRFAINFFTSIGLGGITESLREYLKNMPRLIMQQQKPISESDASSSSEDESGSPTSSSESDSSDSDSDSESESESETESETERNKRKRKRRN